MTAQTVTGAVARRDKADQLVTWLRRQQDDIAMAAATHVKPSAIIRVTQGALRRLSLLHCMLDAARLGHEPGTDQYWLIPFGDEVTGIEGYKGIIERMFRAGGVSSVVAQVVRKADRYVPRGENTPPLHEYDDFAPEAGRGPIRGAYAYAILASGQCSQVVRMGRAEIMEHKKASRGSDRSDSPWQQWEPAMFKKTVLRALEPYVPTSAEYRTVNHMAPASAGSVTHAEAGFTYLPPPPMGPLPAHEIVEAEIVDDPAAETPSDEGAGQEPAGARKPRTRRPAPERPAGAVPDETPASGPAAPAGSPSDEGAKLEVPAEDQPGSASGDQLTSLHITLGGLGFGEKDRDQKLKIAETITGRALTSSKDLSFTEARKLTDTLGGFGGDRSKLIEYMNGREQGGGSDA